MAQLTEPLDRKISFNGSYSQI